MPSDKEQMLNLTFNPWPYSIVQLIKHLTQMDAPRTLVVKSVNRHPPQGEWTPATKQNALIAIELVAEAKKKGNKHV